MLGPVNEDDDDNGGGVCCEHCGASDLHWADHYRADGAQDRRLFTARNRLHECKPNPDDFQEVPE